MDTKGTEEKVYKTAWEAIASDLEGILAKIALLEPDMVVIEVDGSPAFYIEAPARLDRKGLLEYLEAASSIYPRPLEEVALVGLFCDPPREERLAVAYRPPVRMPWGLPFPAGKTNA